jgi:DNA-binding NtrC family response regulator
MKTFKPKVIVLDDEDIVFDYISMTLGDTAECVYSSDIKSFQTTLNSQVFDFAILDIHLEDTESFEMMKLLKHDYPYLAFIVLSSTQEVEDVVKSYRYGCRDFLTKPLKKDYFKQVFKNSLKKSQKDKIHFIQDEIQSEVVEDIIIGKSRAILSLKSSIKDLKGSEIDTLIIADSGCGKELVAKSLHAQESGSTTRPFITLNCSAIPKELMESVLFGHEKGSFTGAISKQLGKFELANGGDIFLDEIATLPLDLQAKLLRTLQEREIEPIGLGYSKKIQFRVIAATNEDLREKVKKGEFRKDLYFRLNKVSLTVSNLKDRKDDIPLLVEYFLNKKKKSYLAKELSQGAVDLLVEHSWPGNVRELENVIEYLNHVVKGSVIESEHVEKFNFYDDLDDFDLNDDAKPVQNEKSLVSTELSLEENLSMFEKIIIEKFLKENSKKQEAAKQMGIDRRTLSRKLKYLGIS